MGEECPRGPEAPGKVRKISSRSSRRVSSSGSARYGRKTVNFRAKRGDGCTAWVRNSMGSIRRGERGVRVQIRWGDLPPGAIGFRSAIYKRTDNRVTRFWKFEKFERMTWAPLSVVTRNSVRWLQDRVQLKEIRLIDCWIKILRLSNKIKNSGEVRRKWDEMSEMRGLRGAFMLPRKLCEIWGKRKKGKSFVSAWGVSFLFLLFFVVGSLTLK